MSDYTSAPATNLLDVRCCACGLPLLDSVSVELGIGPVCRRTRGFDIAVSDDVRAEANAIVARVARHTIDLVPALARLEKLGFDALAARLRERLDARADVTIEREDDTLVVTAPYREAAVEVFRRIRGRRWCRERRANVVPACERAALLAALRECYSGLKARGARGVFTI